MKGILRYLPFAVFILCGAAVVSGQQGAVGSGSGVPGGAETHEIMGMYVVHPLDRLIIVVYAGDKKIEEINEFVKSDGTIYLPFLERDVEIGGMRVLEAEDTLERLARSYVKDPRVVITVTSSYSQSVSTYGKITSMEFQLRTPMRILQLIAKAGGPADGARADSIRVISLDGSIRYFNYEKVNRNPTDAENFFLKPGDIVFVPSAEDFTVMVLGDVVSPGVYPMESGDRLLDALVKAGSWTACADIKNVRMLRVPPRRKVDVREINLKRIFDKGDMRFNYVLRDGDIIFVPTKKTPMITSNLSTILSIVYTALTSYTVMKALK